MSGWMRLGLVFPLGAALALAASCRSRALVDRAGGPGTLTADAAVEGAGPGGTTPAGSDALPGVSFDGGVDRGMPFHLIGEACASGFDCANGLCVDGVCCNSACTSPCARCDAPDATGTCVSRPAGDVPRTISGCVAQAPSTCGLDGRCDGAGGCRLWPAYTRCAAGSCDGDAVVGEQDCDGAGHCKPGATRICVPYTCDPATASCRTGCATDADCRGSYCESTGRCHTSSGWSCTSGDQCASGFCASGVCCNVACTDPAMSCDQPGREGTCWPLPSDSKPNGAACATPFECASGFCADGICCDTSCYTACFSCAVPGSVGHCTAVPAGTPARSGGCPLDPREACGRDGTCNGGGACQLVAAGTVCGPGTCNGATVSGAQACDGRGSCSPLDGVVSCGVYTCDPATGWCRDRCATDADCVGTVCVNGRCSWPPTD